MEFSFLIYHANHVNQAVELAKRLKRKGEYDWFRGQQENWTLISSFGRLSEEDKEKTLETCNRLVN